MNKTNKLIIKKNKNETKNNKKILTGNFTVEQYSNNSTRNERFTFFPKICVKTIKISDEFRKCDATFEIGLIRLPFKEEFTSIFQNSSKEFSSFNS